jgi:2,5-dioxopentanoate dehydrogenase
MFQDTPLQEINGLMNRSASSFNAYRRLSGLQKATVLDDIASEIEALGPALINQAMAETNLPEARLLSERGRTCNQLRQYAALVKEGSWVEARIDKANPDRKPVPKPDVRKMYFPIGPVVVFGASNFPFAYSTAGVDTAAALAAGCSVVLKAHPAHAATSELVAGAIWKALKKNKISEDVFIHVHGASFESGKVLVQHPATKAVGFTGSFSGGKALYDYAHERPDPIPVFAEMGSINPVFILPGALKARSEAVAEMYAGSITQNAGQFCTKPGLLLGVDDAGLNQFAKQLDQRLKHIDPFTMLHPGIASNFRKNKTRALAQHGVTLEAESEIKPRENQGEPTLASVEGKDFINNPTLFEEVFGPYSLLVKASTMEELKAAAEKMPGQLTATIIGEEDELKNNADFIELVSEKAGRVIINGVPTGVEVCASMHHGGPFPATTDSRFSSVGTDAIKRYVRPVCFQNFPEALLPKELWNSNPLEIWRLVDNQWAKN